MKGLRLKVWINSWALAVIAAAALTSLLLKLLGVVSWEWAWVLAPLWIPMGICLLLAAALLLVGFLPLDPAPGTRRWWVR